MYKYRNICYAGTFDHLHIGHKKMIKKAFSVAEKVSLGITSEKMARKKFLGNFIQPFKVRRNTLETYLKKNNYFERTNFFTLNDVYGSSIKDNVFDSILVSEGTKKNAEKINEIRKSRGLNELKIVVGTYILGDDSEIVTSERIRYGEIDRNGESYKLQITNKKIAKLVLPEEMREELRKPLGTVIKSQILNFKLQTNPNLPISNVQNDLKVTANKVIQLINQLNRPMVIAVGDIIVKSMMDLGFDSEIKIIDFRSRRKQILDSTKYFFGDQLASRLKSGPLTPRSSSKFEVSLRRSLAQTTDSSIKIISSVVNEAGTISIKVVKSINSAIKKFFSTGQKQWIVVKGEEDLVTLVAVLFAPLDSLVIYGQWNLGAVVIEVTEEKKKEVGKILKRFKLAV